MTVFETQIRRSIKFFKDEMIGEKAIEFPFTNKLGRRGLLEAPLFDFWIFHRVIRPHPTVKGTTLIQGEFIALEAKECGSDRWPFSKLLPHQRDNLLKVEYLGGKGYLILLFRKGKKIQPTDFCVAWRIISLCYYFNETKEKSIPTEYLKQRCGEFKGNIIQVPFFPIEKEEGTWKIGWDLRIL